MDALRGFALFGILLVNVPAIMNMEGEVGGAQAPIRHALDLFVQYRFNVIFALLFGIGFGIFLQRAAHRHANPRLLLVRRLVFLVPLGAAHQLLHHGEFLLLYGLAGLALLLPLSWAPRWVSLVAGLVLPLIGSSVPGMLVLGYALAQYEIPQTLHARRKQLIVLLVVAVSLSVPAFLLQLHGPHQVGLVLTTAGAGMCMAAAYSSGLVLLTGTSFEKRISAVLEPLGRMALTNYVTATLLVVGLGPVIGLRGSSAWASMLAFCCGIIAAQAVWSRLWLARFRYGPLEWAWRCVTWWQWQPLRVKAPAATGRSGGRLSP
ncbi:DUF418 domain-containing protein [Pseudonocardia sp. H11422]|uniref:DUF418 domain-containing protein n=1 Tax=Pseudonocardia sp. H11422 TaxID=2835866 RepID=UPI002028CF9D|nr:DUF418 domain-containing protein [Pseudonocardia sp. H11422]